MGKSKTDKTDMQAPDQTQDQGAAPEQNPAGEQAAAEAQNAEQTQDQGAAPEQTAAETQNAAQVENVATELFTLDELAEKFRLAGWYRDAVQRMMGWENGKKVSEAVFRKAMAALKNRRMGG